jgi:uncharacterized protein (TIGR02246 family)
MPDVQTEVLDRLEIRDLVCAYAQAVDRPDPEGVAALFTEDGVLVAYAEPGAAEPVTRRQGRAALTKAIGTVRGYRATSHNIGSHLVRLDGDVARGETRCVAYHVLDGSDGERMLVWHLRYLDTYARVEGRWRFAERELRVDIIEERPLRVP